MKQTLLIVAMCIGMFSACTNANKHEETTEKESKHMHNMSGQTSTDNAPFKNVDFASKYDTICGMPLSAGIEDTLHLNGKIYGFCATECKDEFLSKINDRNND